MQSKETKDQERSEEWLNLSLGRSEDLRITEPESLPKIFSCNFCMRKFYSSQALGGHQNAHRRERGAVRHYQSTEMTPLVINSSSVGRSLGVKAHSLVHKPTCRDRASMPVRFGYTYVDEAEDVPMWPGSFRYDPQQPETSATSALDLNQQPEASATSALDLNLKL